MMAFAIHQRESALGIHVSPHPEAPFHLPPHLIPPGCLWTHVLTSLGSVYLVISTYE